MLKKITSVEQIQQLKKGDSLFSDSIEQSAINYSIENIYNDNICAVHNNNRGQLQLKVFSVYDLLHEAWWFKKTSA